MRALFPQCWSIEKSQAPSSLRSSALCGCCPRILPGMPFVPRSSCWEDHPVSIPQSSISPGRSCPIRTLRHVTAHLLVDSPISYSHSICFWWRQTHGGIAWTSWLWLSLCCRFQNRSWLSDAWGRPWLLEKRSSRGIFWQTAAWEVAGQLFSSLWMAMVNKNRSEEKEPRFFQTWLLSCPWFCWTFRALVGLSLAAV